MFQKTIIYSTNKTYLFVNLQDNKNARLYITVVFEIEKNIANNWSGNQVWVKLLYMHPIGYYASLQEE